MVEPNPKPLIVVAEDDNDMRALVAMALRVDGYEVVEAPDGAELLFAVHSANAFAGASGRKPALVISDLRMPYASGMDVLGRLRAEWITVPFVLMSAFVDEQTRTLAEDLGAAGVLAKPFGMKALRQMVTQLLYGGDPSPILTS